MDTVWGKTKAKLAGLLTGRREGFETSRNTGHSADQPRPRPTTPQAAAVSSKAVGDAAETRALQWLQAQGLTLVQRNYRVARGPRARGGEIDLVMRERDGTVVFVEVRSRAKQTQGGAAASVTISKQRSLVLAAQHFLRTLPAVPACRFDVLAIDGEQIEWLQAAFNAE